MTERSISKKYITATSAIIPPKSPHLFVTNSLIEPGARIPTIIYEIHHISCLNKHGKKISMYVYRTKSTISENPLMNLPFFIAKNYKQLEQDAEGIQNMPGVYLIVLNFIK